MAFFSYKNIEIDGLASCVPKTVVEVDSFKKRFGKEDVEKFKLISGIKQFRKSVWEQTASDMGFVAAKKILSEKKIATSQIGAIVFASHSFDYRRPATACVLHKRLELASDCVAFDLNLGCSAFVYGMLIVCSLMTNSNMEYALLVVGETNSKNISPDDKALVMLMGDGGGAVLLKKNPESGDIKGSLKTDGEGYKSVIIPAGGYRNLYATKKKFIFADGNKRTLYNTFMNGVDVFNFTISDVPKTIKEFFDYTDTNTNDYDCFALHQANKYIQDLIIKRIKIPKNKAPLSLDRYGNTSSASIPITLCDKYGMFDKQEIIRTLMCGFGVGLSWGVLSADIKKSNVFPLTESDDYYPEGFINSPDQL